MKKIFNNLDELESFFIKEKNFILNLMFYKIEEAVENQDEEVYILDAFVKDIYLHMKLNTHKKDFGPTLDKLEEYFADLEEYEKCAKIVEYKKLLSLGML